MTDNPKDTAVLDTVADNLSELATGSIDTVNELATRVESETASQALQDIAQNIDDQSPEFQTAIREYAKGNQPAALKNAYEAATETGGNTTRAVVTGGLVGSVGGPIGSLLGAIVAGSVVCVYEMRDGRKLWAISLDDDQIPAHASVTDSSEEPLKDNSDIQYLLEEVFESDSDWSELEQRLTRDVDFTAITEILNEIPHTQAESEDQYSGYYVQHSGQKIVLMLGEEIEAETPS